MENVNTIEERRSKSIETMFSIDICRLTGDKWQSKTLFLLIFDPRSSIVDNVFDCRLPIVINNNNNPALLLIFATVLTTCVMVEE